MVHWQLKICVLSAIVVMSYSNRMQGISLWCVECKKVIEKGAWGQHVYKQHKDDGRRPLLYCSEHKATFKSGSQLEVHLELYHAGKGWDKDLRSYKLWCKACDRELLVSEWEFHSEIDCVCKHMRGEHHKVLEENRLFYCKKCGENVGNSWNAHVVGEFHRNDSERGAFYCPGCAGLTKEVYEQHCGEVHPGQCVFCKKSVKDERNLEDLKKHMKEEHKVSCPICGKKSLDVPLEVHIKREHEICEVSKICEVFGVKPDIFKGFAPYCPADFLIKYLLKKNFVYYLGNMLESWLHLCRIYNKTGCLWCPYCREYILPAEDQEGRFSFDCHLAEWHGQSFEKCKYCDRMCFKKDMNDHLEKEHFACEQCNFKCFESVEELHEHRRKEHKCQECNMKCNICKGEYTFDESSLIQHYRVLHLACFDNICPVCKKIFSNFNLLSEHVGKEHSDKGITCDVCRKFVSRTSIFNNIEEVKLHQNLHFVWCNDCKRQIKQKKDSFREFGKHMRTCHRCTPNCEFDPETLMFQHSGCEHLVPCPVCPEKFVAKYKEKHQNDHGCDRECPLWKNTKEKEHHFNCALKVFPKCPIGGCFEENVPQTHLFKQHGCGSTCRIIIESGKCKIVHIADGELKEGHDPEACSKNHMEEKYRKEEEEKRRKKEEEKRRKKEEEGHTEDCLYDKELEEWMCGNNCPVSYPPFKCPVCDFDNADREHMEKHCTKGAVCYQKKGTSTWIHGCGCFYWDENENDEFNDNENDAFGDNENDESNDNENDAFGDNENDESNDNKNNAFGDNKNDAFNDFEDKQ